MKKIIVFSFFVWISFYVLVGSKQTYVKEKEIIPKPEIIVVIHETDNINNIIKLDKEYFLERYLEYFNHNKNVSLIFNKALEENISVSLALALAFSESSLNEKKYNINKNKSIDRGLFMLNSNSYPFLTKTQMYDPVINTKYGIAHIKKLLIKHNSIVTALATYNCGSIERINPMTFRHVSRILNKEKELNKMLVDSYEQFEWSQKLKNNNSSKIL